jgi:hypothetical protein
VISYEYPINEPGERVLPTAYLVGAGHDVISNGQRLLSDSDLVDEFRRSGATQIPRGVLYVFLAHPKATVRDVAAATDCLERCFAVASSGTGSQIRVVVVLTRGEGDWRSNAGPPSPAKHRQPLVGPPFATSSRVLAKTSDELSGYLPVSLRVVPI